MLASIVGYAIALRTSKLLDMEHQIARLPVWAKRFKIGSPAFLIAVRLIPGMGGTIATQAAATLHVPLWRQVYTMCAVTVPLSTLLAFGGHAISTYFEKSVVLPAERYATKHAEFLRHHQPHSLDHLREEPERKAQ